MKIGTPLTTQTEHYSDFRKDFMSNPITDDLVRVVNEDSIKQSLYNLIMTNRGDRLYQPTIGCDVKRILFENVTPDRLLLAREYIKNTISMHEHRVNVISIDVTGALDSNAIAITITYNVLNKEEPDILNIQMERIR